MVIHAEYVDDLPEELKSRFLMYCFNYGIHGEEPQLQGLESVIWIKAKRRIDADKGEYTKSLNAKRLYNARNHYKQGRATKEEMILLKQSYNLADLAENGSCQNLPPYTPGVFVSDTVSVNDNVSDIDSVSVFDNESVSDSECVSVYDNVSEGEPLAPDYSQAIFNLYKDADLPCCKGNYTSFIQRDFKTALEYLKGYHSDEVIQAVKNYIAELKNPDSFISQKMNFDSFVRSKLFSRMLPDNYSAENNKDFEKQKFNSSIPFYDTSTRTLDSIRARQKEEDERWEREHGKQNTEMS